MIAYKKLFMQCLHEHNVPYTEPADELVMIDLAGENTTTSSFVIFKKFDRETVGVSFFCSRVINIKDKVEEALKVCNKLNHGKITKFFVDEDGNVQCGADLFVCEENCAHACWIVLIKMLSDIDKVYPQFAKIKFS